MALRGETIPLKSAEAVLLIQFNRDDPDSRTYLSYAATRHAINGLCTIYERTLDRHSARSADGQISYSVDELFRYLRGLAELVLIEHRRNTGELVVRNREWLLQQLLEILEARMNRVAR